MQANPADATVRASEGTAPLSDSTSNVRLEMDALVQLMTRLFKEKLWVKSQLEHNLVEYAKQIRIRVVEIESFVKATLLRLEAEALANVMREADDRLRDYESKMKTLSAKRFRVRTKRLQSTSETESESDVKKF